jgi:inorganic pyrophosphatase
MQAPCPKVEVLIEIPKGSFLKRGSNGHIDFISPFPCPFNYGCVPGYIGGEGDLLDAVVLGPRLPLWHRVTVPVRGAVGLSERFMYDDKLICSVEPLTPGQRRRVLAFFHFYARCKDLLNKWRGRPGKAHCEGWDGAEAALARARPVPPDWQGPEVPF